MDMITHIVVASSFFTSIISDLAKNELLFVYEIQEWHFSILTV